MSTPDSKDYVDFLMKYAGEQLALARHHETIASSTGVFVLGIVALLTAINTKLVVESEHISIGIDKLEAILIVKALLLIVALSRISSAFRAKIYHVRASVFLKAAANIIAKNYGTDPVTKLDLLEEIESLEGFRRYTIRPLILDYGLVLSYVIFVLALVVCAFYW